MKTDFQFKGLMVPVFTPFKDDYTINYDVIDQYAQFLQSSGVQGVFVNSYTGEGMTLTLEERKKLSEIWYQITRKYGMKIMVNIGGMPVSEVYELARHAEQFKFDAVAVLPDLYYKPKTAEDLVYYFKDIYKYMPTRPFFYYHIPMMTELYDDYINYHYFMQLMEKEVPTFTGFYYADYNIDQVLYLREKKPEYYYIIAGGVSMMAYHAEGFESFSMAGMNLYPKMVKEFYDYMSQYKYKEAFAVKEKYIKSVYGLFGKEKYYDYIYTMKSEMNKLYPFKFGPVRKPYASKYFF